MENMKDKKIKLSDEVLEYQPDAVEIEERSVPGSVRWVLYIIIGTLIGIVVGAATFQIDRIVTAQGKLITSSPTIVVQSLNTAMVRSIDVEVGNLVEKGQLLATLDSTFASADLHQLKNQQLVFKAQLRRVEAEIKNSKFTANVEEGEDGKLQESLFLQRKQILHQKHQMSRDKSEALEARLTHNQVLQNGQKRQLSLLRDVEGETARLPQKNNDYRLRLLEAQKERTRAINEIESLQAEEQVIANELKQVKSEWEQFLAEWRGDLLHQKIQLRNEFDEISEEINKAERLHELVSLRAPENGIVLALAERSVGSIIQQAEPFITLVPTGSSLEVEVNVQSKDIARIRISDPVRIKLDAFPFQKHDTLPGEVRVISEDTFQITNYQADGSSPTSESRNMAFYRTRIKLLSYNLRNVPDQFRLMPGMKVRAEIKVGKRRIISYFLYPIIRALDESFREP